jgi:protein-S-isoprenylcysteine O-methyltransferase Ste14
VTVERDPPALLLALLLLALAAGPVAAFGESHHLAPMNTGAWLGWTGVVLAACGLGVRIAAMAQLGPRFSPLVSLQREHALETRGLYARIRHPGYSGAWIAALGAALTFSSALALPLVAAFGLCLWVRARREEGLLERQFGDAYRAYRARSGRFFPRLG